ncbi:MAG: hypothetical protein L3J82_09205, partial [Planctomycetes bacterium]|nr:hypothetical protein [Planctomycetota bacterium]
DWLQQFRIKTNHPYQIFSISCIILTVRLVDNFQLTRVCDIDFKARSFKLLADPTAVRTDFHADFETVDFDITGSS